MVFIVKLTGILVITISTISFLVPTFIKQIISLCIKGSNVYIFATLRMLLGLIFLVSYPEARLPNIILIIGILILLNGILVFILGQQKVKYLLSHLQEKSPKVLRIMAMAAFIAGVLIIYAI